MQVCGQCGVLWAPESKVCDGCGSSLPPLDREPDPALRCAALRLQFRCASCDRWAPLDGVDVSGEARCTSCGMVTPIDDAAWRSLLGAAHAVADLVGPDPEGFAPSPVAIDVVNPFAELAPRRSSVQLAPERIEGLTGWLPPTLRAWMAPGLPLSGDGKRVWRFRTDGEGTLEGSAGSGERRRYRLDPRVVALHPKLLGAVADEHEVDRPEPDLVQAGSRLVCAGCRAEFVLDGTEPRVRCATCGTVSRVPAALRHAAQGAEPRPDTWWLVFRGSSPYRARLEGRSVSEDPAFPRPELPDLDWEDPPPRVSDLPDLALSWGSWLGLPLLLLGLAGLLGAVVQWL